MGTTQLFGRARERARIDGMLDRVRRGGSAALLIRGEPGIGKSALLEHAVTAAAGFLVLRARGYESESEIPFAGLSDILRPIMARLDALPPPQRAALESTLALTPTTPTSNFAVCAATLGILATVAEERPTLVLVDDAHWLDPSSADALRFTARRLHGEGIAMLFAARPTGRDDRSDAGIPTMELEGLDYAAARELLDRRTGRPVNDTVARQLFEVSAGNPLALIEIPTLLSDDDVSRTPVPAGTTMERVFHRRLEQLPVQAREALTVAAADQSGELTSITVALDQLGLGIAALDPAEQAAVVSVDDGRVAFAHPLLRSTAYHDAPLSSRCAAHRALADAYAGVAGDRAADARAWHLAVATLAPDDDVARTLQDMAERARRRGAYVEAARAFGRAADLTRDPQARGRRLTHAAKAWQLSGRVGRAGQLLDAALEVITDPVARAEIQHLRGYVRMWREAPAGVADLLEREADAVAELDPDRAARMLADAAVPVFMAGDVGTALTIAQRAQDVSRRGSTTSRRVADVVVAVAHATQGDRDAAAPLLADVRAWLDVQPPLHRAQEVIFAAMTAMWLEDHAGAGDLLDRLIRQCRQSSALGVLPYALGLRSALDMRTGRWQQGLASVTESIRLAEETHQANTYGVFFLGHLHATMGAREDAERSLSRADELADAYGIGCMPLYTGAARGLLELGVADIDAALHHLELVHDLQRRMGVVDPVLAPSAGDFAEALVRAGRSDDAMQVVGDLLQPSADAGSRWAGWTVARVCGLRDGTLDATAQFREALALHDQLAWPFERARTAMCFGEVLRRNRRRTEAREQLRAALDCFERLGAEPWAQRTRAELEATGGHADAHRVSASVHLTPQELQVALAVAEGATNAEVAAALFLSAKTIEYHLSKIYRKAGLSSRDQLADLIAAHAP
jgi:DNA-binding CsgD family transcriptional regulator